MRSCRCVFPRRLPIHLHEAKVFLGDLARRGVALEVAVLEALERVPPDRAADGEAGVALHGGALAQPVVDLVVVGPPTQYHADHAVAPVAATGLHDLLAVLTAVDSLDLPDVRLDAGVLELLDRATHQLGTQL